MASMNLLTPDVIKSNTNIKNVKIDPRLRERIPCGPALGFINVCLSGEEAPEGARGFTPSNGILFTGTPGAGKSTMGLQMSDDLTGQGHMVLYNTGEESAAQVAMTVERLELQHGFIIGTDTFVDRPAKKEDAKRVKRTLREHMDELLVIHKAANAARKKNGEKPKHFFVIIDSLQCMNDGKWGFASNNKTPIRVLEELITYCKTNFMVLIVIGQVNKAGEFKGDNTLLHMVDCHIHLFVEEDDKSPHVGKRVFEVRKNRFGPSGLAVYLDIGKHGLREYGSRVGARRV